MDDDKDFTWILIHAADPEKAAWTGQVRPPKDPRESWRFELVRPHKGIQFYDQLDAGWNGSLTGLLDLQSPCTLLGVRALHTIPGSMGIYIRAFRTIIEGEFDDLVTNIALDDPATPVVRGLGFKSEALAIWLCRDDARHGYENETSTIAIAPALKESFEIENGQRLEIRAQTLVSMSVRKSALKATASLRVVFPHLVSVLEARQIAASYQLLLAFLVGYREPPTRIGLEAEIDGHDIDAHLTTSGLDWNQREAPHSNESLTVSEGLGVSLETAARALSRDPESLFERMNVVLFATQTSKNLNDRFTAVLPVLETYLSRRFSTGDEEAYHDQKAAFFAWVERSEDPKLREFSRKHIKTVARKSPSLPMLLGRAMDHLNARGFNFAPTLARRIQQRRSSLFHSTIKPAADEGLRFFAEAQAATAVLMFLTLEDLGVDLKKLAAEPLRLGSFRLFRLAPA